MLADDSMEMPNYPGAIHDGRLDQGGHHILSGTIFDIVPRTSRSAREMP